MKELNYRQPNIEEFVSGFTFEVEKKYRGGYAILDFSKTSCKETELHLEDFYTWEKEIVPDFNEKFYTFEGIENSKWTVLTKSIFGTEEKYLKRIEQLLKENKIRCKN